MHYKRQFTDEEKKLVEYYVEDLEKWIDGMIDGKINACKKRLLKQELEKAMDSEEPLAPKNMLKSFLASEHCKSRKERDAQQLEDFKNGKPIKASI